MHASVKLTTETHTGQAVNLSQPRIETIRLADIAHALASRAVDPVRLDPTYTYAQRAIAICERLEMHTWRAALLHNAYRAYLNIQPESVITLIPELRSIADQLDEVIREAMQVTRTPATGKRIMQAEAEVIEAEPLLYLRGSRRRDRGSVIERYLTLFMQADPSEITQPRVGVGDDDEVSTGTGTQA